MRTHNNINSPHKDRQKQFIIILSEELNSKMESKLAVKGILARNNHQNCFQMKIPSHNASSLSVQNMCHGFVLNRLAPLPFHEDQQLTRLYQTSLQCLLQLPKEHFKCEQFVDDLIEHLTIWDSRMRQFDSWPFTRAAFYSVEEKVKKNKPLWERVVLQRACLEPNKKQFLNQVLSQNFQNKQLLALISKYSGKEPQKIEDEHVCDLPRDILFEDKDQCWLKLEEKLQELDQGRVQDYLEEYESRGVARYVARRGKGGEIDDILRGLELRKRIVEKYLNFESKQFEKEIQILLERQKQ